MNNEINYLPETMSNAGRPLSPLHRAELFEGSPAFKDPEKVPAPLLLHPDGRYTELDYWFHLRHGLTDPYEGSAAKSKWEWDHPEEAQMLHENPPWIPLLIEALASLSIEIPLWVVEKVGGENRGSP